MVAGLQKPTFAKATSLTRTTTSVKLATSDRSTAYSKANQKQSLSAVRYGIGAQRTAAGSGLIFNPSKLRDYRATISAQRHYYNDKREGGLYTPPMPQTAPLQSAGNNSGRSSLDKFTLGMQAVNTLTDSLGQILDLSKSGKSSKSGNSSKSNSSVDNMNGAQDNNAGKTAIDGMENAKDSTALKEAIGNANGTLEKLEGQEQDLTEHVNNETVKREYDEAKAGLQDQKKLVKDKERSYKELAGNVNEQKKSLDVAERARDSAKEQCDIAAKKAGKSAEGVTTATTALGDAKSTLARTPEKIKDKEGKEIENPAYKTAKEQVEQKEAELKSAKEALANDKEVEAKAKDNYNAEQDTYQTQTKKFADTEKNLEKAKTACTQAEKELEDAQEKLKDMQDTVNDFENSKKELAEVKEQREKLQAQITKQQARLTQLQNKDQSDLDKINKQIADLDAKISKNNAAIDTTDGVSGKEKRADKNNSNYKAKRAELQEQARVLEQRIAASKAD